MMKSLYEGILDADKKIIKQNKTALLRSFCEIVCEVLPDMHIVFTPDKSTVVGTLQTNNVVNVLGRLKSELEKIFPNNVTSNRKALQLHVNLPYEGDLIRCSFVFSRLAVGRTLREGIVMNIQADKQKTLNEIKKIFDEKIPW